MYLIYITPFSRGYNNIKTSKVSIAPVPETIKEAFPSEHLRAPLDFHQRAYPHARLAEVSLVVPEKDY